MTDGRLKYNVDGKSLVEASSTDEALLSEVSWSYYSKNSKGKTSFDHHKAMFGLLAMIRTIAGLYQYSSLDSFFKTKAPFRPYMHTTMSTPVPDVYVMSKEQRVGIIDELGKRNNYNILIVCHYIDLNHRKK
ncbi:hypothetical protein [Parasitella parasitica]|uniref:Uncharacterized protein n=1 Tax=Parasitella parasitica TaxID=35722 RepID=A0A0B7NTB9_9FUNG|nr:hypothetical protein [Parasitella parasitica]